jgi:hypothetical protein
MNAFQEVDLSAMVASGPDGVCSGVYPTLSKTYSYSALTREVVTLTGSVSSSGIAVVCLKVDGQICAADATQIPNGSGSATCIRPIEPGAHVFDIVLLQTGIIRSSASLMVVPL